MNTEVSIVDIIMLLGVIVALVKVFLPSIWPSKVDESTIKNKRADVATKFEKLLGASMERIEAMEAEMAANKAEYETRVQESDARFAKLQEEVRVLRAQLHQRDKLLDELQDGIERLIKQLEAHRLTPAWTPPKRQSKTAEI